MNSFFGSPLIGFIILDIVIVVLLYSATYIGFLAILRHQNSGYTVFDFERRVLQRFGNGR
jgi:hypothetical protein